MFVVIDFFKGIVQDVFLYTSPDVALDVAYEIANAGGYDKLEPDSFVRVIFRMPDDPDKGKLIAEFPALDRKMTDLVELKEKLFG